MSNTIFPRLVGETWPVKKESVFSTTVQTSQAGMEVRVANWPQGRYRWTIPYGYLNHDAAIATADLQIMEGLFGSAFGKFDTLLYSDPTDSFVTGSIFGVGNGSTTAFQLSRTRGAFTHWIYNVDSTSAAPKIYINGVIQTTGYAINSAGLVTFSGAPSGGAVLTVEFSYYFRVRFDMDELELTNECGPYWTIKEVILFEVMGNR